MDVILVQLELVGCQDPAPLAPVTQSPGPPSWPYYLGRVFSLRSKSPGKALPLGLDETGRYRRYSHCAPWEPSERRAIYGQRGAFDNGRNALYVLSCAQIAKIVPRRGKNMDATGRYRPSSRSWVGVLLGTSSLSGPAAWGALLALLLLSLAIPASAQVASPSEQSPTLSVSERLDDRRYVATGTRGYIVGTEAGRFPAMGWHIQGEMGGIWSPPIKLLDGLWFGVDGEWLGEARTFTSGYGFVQMDGIDGPEGLTVRRTDFVPDDKRGALVGLELTSPTDRQISLTVDAHSELMSAYPWGGPLRLRLQPPGHRRLHRRAAGVPRAGQTPR